MLDFLKSRSQREDEVAMQKFMETRLHRIQAELIENSYVWTDVDTGQFIAQGQSDSEIRDVLKSVWANHVFVVGPKHMIMGPDFEQPIEFDTAEEELS